MQTAALEERMNTRCQRLFFSIGGLGKNAYYIHVVTCMCGGEREKQKFKY